MKEKGPAPEYYSRNVEEISKLEKEIEQSIQKLSTLQPKAAELLEKVGHLNSEQSQTLEYVLAEILRMDTHIRETRNIIKGLTLVENRGKKFLKKYNGPIQ